MIQNVATEDADGLIHNQKAPPENTLLKDEVELHNGGCASGAVKPHQIAGKGRINRDAKLINRRAWQQGDVGSRVNEHPHVRYTIARGLNSKTYRGHGAGGLNRPSS